MFGYPVLSILIILPLAAALCLVFVRGEEFIRRFSLGASIVTLFAALPLLAFKSEAGFQFVERMPWVEAWGLEYHLAVDGISILMIWLTLFTLPMCVLCSWTYIKTRVREFHICLLLMSAACVGVFAAMDFVLFYVFWEAMLIPMYLLIAVWGGDQKRYASLKFFIYTLAGSTLLLAAIVAFRHVGGTFSIPDLMKHEFSFRFQFWAFLAMGIAFAIKVPMFPFHTWLPAAHVQAPSAGSVFLAAVLLKMGAYGFMRFCVELTPLGSQHFTPLMIVLSLVAIIYGGAVALGQNDIKKLIAYSSVAHMGFVTLGIFLFDVRGVQGAIMQMFNHGIITGGLFMMIGSLYERSHSRLMSDNMGLGRYMPAFMGFWGLCALASLGFPGTNGFIGEFLVFVSAFGENSVIGAFMVPGALLSAAYMLRVSIRMAWGSPSTAANWPDLNKREWSFMLLPAAMVIIIGLHPAPFINMVTPDVERMVLTYKLRTAPIVKDVKDGLALNTVTPVEERTVASTGQALSAVFENIQANPDGVLARLGVKNESRADWPFLYGMGHLAWAGMRALPAATEKGAEHE